MTPELRLRRRAELDALKLYFLFAARRDNKLHLAKIGYDKIAESSGVGTNYIRAAISVLAAHNLVHVVHLPSSERGAGVVNGYRLAFCALCERRRGDPLRPGQTLLVKTAN